MDRLLGNGKTCDGFEDKHFHYLMANPPFGAEWKNQKDVVEREHKTVGFLGRFGAGLLAINDGTRFFRKMKKSLNNKRNEIAEEQIRHLTRVHSIHLNDETTEVQIGGEAEIRLCQIENTP